VGSAVPGKSLQANPNNPVNALGGLFKKKP
jgi:hypothetical protein